MEQAPLSILSPSTTTTIYRDVPIKYGGGTNTISVVALILALLAIFILIVIIILWFINYYNMSSGPTWHIVLGKSNGSNSSNETFIPKSNDVLIIGALSSKIMVNVQDSKSNFTGKIFMIDNTANSQHIEVSSTTLTIIDNIDDGKICAQSTATYMWTSKSVVRRLY